MKFEPCPWMTTGAGIFPLGLAWLLFWLGPAFHLHDPEPGWTRKFAFALIFIIAGIASFRPSVSTGVISLFASFITIPAELAYGSGAVATLMEGVLLGAIIMVVAAEWKVQRPLSVAGPKTGFGSGFHLRVLSCIGIARMPLIFFHSTMDRCSSVSHLPPGRARHSTAIFNAIVLVLMMFAIAGHDAKEIRGFGIQRTGFSWAVLILIIPLASIGIFGQ